MLKYSLIEGKHDLKILVPFMKETKKDTINIQLYKKYFYKVFLESEVFDFPEVNFGYDKLS
jgi:hypothetical protein